MDKYEKYLRPFQNAMLSILQEDNDLQLLGISLVEFSNFIESGENVIPDLIVDGSKFVNFSLSYHFPFGDYLAPWHNITCNVWLADTGEHYFYRSGCLYQSSYAIEVIPSEQFSLTECEYYEMCRQRLIATIQRIRNSRFNRVNGGGVWNLTGITRIYVIVHSYIFAKFSGKYAVYLTDTIYRSILNDVNVVSYDRLSDMELGDMIKRLIAENQMKEEIKNAKI